MSEPTLDVLEIHRMSAAAISPNTSGECAKAHIACTLITPDGERFIGTNWCKMAQPVCPRAPGEDYTKCRTICQQVGHAEIVALEEAGAKARGAHAYVVGHSHVCRHCQEALYAAGVVAITVGLPPRRDF